MTVEDALKEVSTLFPLQYFDIQMFGSRDGIAWSAQVGWASAAQHFREDSLTELMGRIRQWHKEQSNV